MEELYRFRQFLTEDKQLKENVEDDFKTYYERWEDEFALTNVPGVKGNVFNFDDEDEWEDDIRQPGSKIGDHSWEVSYEEEDDYYEPIINNMLNYLKKNKTYSYKNDDGVDAEFTYDDRGNSIDMSVIYSADDIEKYENELNENKKIYRFRQFLAEGKLLKEDQKYYSLLNDLRDEGLLNKSGISGLQSKFNLSKEKAKEIFDEYLEDLKAEQPDAFDFFMKDLAEGKLYEAINLDIEDDIVYLSGDSGEYEGEIEDGKTSFSIIYDDLDYRISDQYDENNIEDFLGKGHAFVELAKKYDHKWGIERDLVGITIKLN